MQVIDPAKEFARSLAKVLVHEGGHSNHPKDLGAHRGKNDKRFGWNYWPAGWHLLTSKPS